jgi:hypothetical protein
LVKLQQYYIYKFETDRLKDDNYDIIINPHQARKNGELVSIGDSQMLRSLREIKGLENDKEEIKFLFEQKKKLKNKLKSPEVKLSLFNIEARIDEILFVPEIISIVVKNIKHYEYIIENGVFINNKKFVRLMCSAGQARRNNVLFIDSDYELLLKTILNNDRKDIEIAPAKFNAYFALASSTALPVSTPYFCVIPDCELKRTEQVEYITEVDGQDDIIEEAEKELTFNLFDGQGIISPRGAEIWAKELGLDYIPSCFVIRSNFIKGMVAVVDFLEYSNEIGKHIIKDIYGNDVNIRDMDVILTASQFKLYDAFDSTQDYVEKCRKNKLGWGVTRCSPKEENSHTFLNYQFIQALNLNDEQIKSLSSKTVEYFNNVTKNNLDYTLLYLLGSLVDKQYDENIFYKINDNVTKALILNNKLIDDVYIQNHIIHSLNKKIRESYIGNLLVDGFYTFMVADPYAFLQYVFGEEITGLLKRNEHYCKYWITRKKKTIAGMRSPLTWRSEVDVLHLVSNDETDKWYKYLNNCCIFNINGMDMAILGGSDLDGDIICLTDQKEIIEGAYGGLPLVYETRKVPKSKIIENELYKSDIKGFNTKVGFLTNLSTTMYSMLPRYQEDSPEYKEIIRRLKQCRKEQGAIIDATKGLIIKPIPAHWTNWNHIDSTMEQDAVDRANFNNSILVDKRPQFMQHLYGNYNKEYKKYFYNYNLFSTFNFGMEINEILSSASFVDAQLDFIEKFNKYNPLLDTDCIMNKISRHMQEQVKEIRIGSRGKTTDDVVRILKSPDFDLDKNKLKRLAEIHKKYKAGKRNFSDIKDDNNESKYTTIEQYSQAIKQEALDISSDISELASLAVVICYELYPNDNKMFAWGVFGDGIIENITKNKQRKIQIPFFDKNGNIKYLGKKYSRMEITVKDAYDFL